MQILDQAIENIAEARDIQYVRFGQPGNIISLIGLRAGIPVDAMADWDSGGTPLVDRLYYGSRPGTAQMVEAAGNINLLLRLQLIWNSQAGYTTTESDLAVMRKRMRRAIAWFAERGTILLTA